MIIRRLRGFTVCSVASRRWALVELAVPMALATLLCSAQAFGQPAGPPRPVGPKPAQAPMVIGPGDGPRDGLTLKEAEDRFLRENVELQALRLEIPMAQANVEALGQLPQTHLLFKVGPEGIRTFEVRRPEFPSTLWVDGLLARIVKGALEAQYRDAVRTRMNDLHRAFVDFQAAELAVRYDVADLRAAEVLLQTQESLQKSGRITDTDFTRVKNHTHVAALRLAESKTARDKARLELADLINLPDAEVDHLKVVNDLKDTTSAARQSPPPAELIRIALSHRPDLDAYRLGLRRAALEWIKALLEPINQINVRLWRDRIDGSVLKRDENAAIGGLNVVVSLPTNVRNRARLKRASINVEQGRLELLKVERQVRLDVRKAQIEYEQSRVVVDRFRSEIIPNAQKASDQIRRAFGEGEASATDYFSSLEEMTRHILHYREAATRLRMGILALNTAVGERVLP